MIIIHIKENFKNIKIKNNEKKLYKNKNEKINIYIIINTCTRASFLNFFSTLVLICLYLILCYNYNVYKLLNF